LFSQQATNSTSEVHRLCKKKTLFFWRHAYYVGVDHYRQWPRQVTCKGSAVGWLAVLNIKKVDEEKDDHLCKILYRWKEIEGLLLYTFFLLCILAITWTGKGWALNLVWLIDVLYQTGLIELSINGWCLWFIRSFTIVWSG